MAGSMTSMVCNSIRNTFLIRSLFAIGNCLLRWRRLNFSIGGGFGYSRISYDARVMPSSPLNFSGRDNAIAFPRSCGNAGPVSDNIDLGAKYRHFESAKLKFGDFLRHQLRRYSGLQSEGRLESNSLLASLIYISTRRRLLRCPSAGCMSSVQGTGAGPALAPSGGLS